MNLTNRDREILALNQGVLDAVVQGDWASYASRCCDSLSCFEAETEGVLVEGLDFHQFYFPKEGSNPNNQAAVTVTMARPHLRWLSDDAVVLSYTRLVQRHNDGVFTTSACCETRIWQNQSGTWKQVHVHRS